MPEGAVHLKPLLGGCTLLLECFSHSSRRFLGLPEHSTYLRSLPPARAYVSVCILLCRALPSCRCCGVVGVLHAVSFPAAGCCAGCRATPSAGCAGSTAGGAREQQPLPRAALFFVCDFVPEGWHPAALTALSSIGPCRQRHRQRGRRHRR